MIGRSEPVDSTAVCDTGGKSLIAPVVRCNPVCDAGDLKIQRADTRSKGTITARLFNLIVLQHLS